MRDSGVTEDACYAWMDSLPILPWLQKAVPSMIISLSEELVLAALARMKTGTTLGAAKLPTQVFMALSKDCVRPMLWAVQHGVQQGATYPNGAKMALGWPTGWD